MKQVRKWWLEAALVISGAESEGGAEGNPGEGDPGSGDQDPGDSGDGDNADSGEGDDDKSTFTKEEVENLRKALKAERTARKNLERTQREAAKAQGDAEKQASDDQAAKAVADALARVARLSEGYLTTRVESAIMAEARAQQAIAPEDVYSVLSSKKFEGIDIDQDPEDPSKIEIDADDLKQAVKNLLKTRLHWVKAPGDGNPSGSRFTPGSKSKDTLDQEALRSAYPALRMSR
jgi:uncharacterized membrane protein